MNYKSLAKWILLLLPIICLFTVIYLYGYNIPFSDEYAFIRSYKEILQGGDVFKILFSQHNDHRLFFPRILMYLTAYVSNYNTKIQMYESAVLLTLTYFCFSRMITEKKISELSMGECITIAISGFLVTGLCQNENLLWGMQVAWLMIGTCAAWAMYSLKKFLETQKNRYYICIFIAASISCFSSLHGIVTWLALIVIILIVAIQERRFLPKWGGVYLAALVELILYFATYNQPYDDKLTTGVGMTLMYFFMQIGSPIFNGDKKIQMILGIVICSIIFLFFIIVIRKKRFQQFSDLFGIIAFSMGVAMMCAIGRSNNKSGGLSGVSSRYKTFQVMLLAALVILVFKYCMNDFLDKKSYYSVGLVIMAAITTGCFLENATMINVCKSALSARQSLEIKLLNYEDEELETLREIYPLFSYERAYDLLDFMQENKLSVFSKNLEKTYDEISVEAIKINYEEGAVIFPGRDEIYWDEDYRILSIGSWAKDAINNVAYNDIIIKINDHYYKTKDNIERKDVSDFFGNEEFLYSGFEFHKNTRELHNGINELNVVLVSNNGIDAHLSETVYIYKNEDGAIYFCDAEGNSL